MGRARPTGQGPARGRARPIAPSSPRSAGPRRRLPGIVERGSGPPAARTTAHSVDSTRGWRRRFFAAWTAAGGSGIGAPAARRGGIRRPAGPARQTLAPRRPPRVSGRAAALGVLLFALMLAYAYPVRVYLAQQAQISQMQTDQAEQQQRIQDLAERLERWNDEAYVIAQARSRLQMVREGELLYVVGVPSLPEGSTQTPEDQAWFRRLWSNLQTADEPAAP